MTMMRAEEPISPSDPLFSLKHFIRDLLTKIDVLWDIQNLLHASYAPDQGPPIQPDAATNFRRHMIEHSNRFNDMLVTLDELKQEMQEVNQRLLNGIVAFGRWELPDSTLREEVVREWREKLYELAHEALDIDDQIYLDMEGMRTRLGSIVDQALAFLRGINRTAFLVDVEGLVDDVRDQLEMMHC